MARERLKEKIESALAAKALELSGVNPYACYQCGKCSGGCPSISLMDLSPNQLIRTIQIGDVETALNSNTIWICATCFTCTVRCPKGVDLAKLMEALRQIKLRKNIDHARVRGIPKEEIGILPQIALVSNFRKQTA